MARLLRFAWLLPIFIFHASRFVMTVMIYDHFWLFMVTLWIFMAIWTSICLNVAFPNARQIEARRCWRRTLDCRLGMAWVGWGKHVSWVAWGFVFCVGLARGLWVFVWFRNWVPCRYILKEVQRPELYIQKGVPVSWVNQYTLSSIRVLHSKDRWHSFLSDSTIKVSISPSLIYIKLISDLEVVVASCINH